LVKVTIVPRGRSLGAAWYLPEERQITTTEQLLDEMCSALGGRAAELIMFGKISTGALSDLEKVTKQAYAMVSIYGLSAKLGNISYYDSQGQSAFTKPYSEDRAKLIDLEVSRIIEEQFERAVQILTDNKEKLILLGEKLLEKEVIFKDNLIEIFGKRVWEKDLLEEVAEHEKQIAIEAEKKAVSESDNTSEVDTTVNNSEDENTTDEKSNPESTEDKTEPTA
jgi:cell division protease FtsH